MTYRIAAATGFAGDRIEPARILAERGCPDALVYECLAERTIGLAQHRSVSGAGSGYDHRFLHRFADVLPALGDDTLVLTNAGAADPVGLAAALSRMIRDSGGRPRPVAAVVGDDVTHALPGDTRILGTDFTVRDLGDRVVSANAYIGAAAAVEALDRGAQVVVTGRMGDAALFAAPLVRAFGRSPDSATDMAPLTLIGHLLECAGQLSGGYYADGRHKIVPGLATLGFPYADVAEDGAAVFGKVEGTGGMISRATVLEQLLYEIDDPGRYQTPDATLDLRGTVIDDLGGDRVRVSGARADGRPDRLKVSVGVRDGVIGVGSIAYAGAGALDRARLALEIVRERWTVVHGRDEGELRLDLQGFNSLRPWHEPEEEPGEVRARASLRTFDRASVDLLHREVEALYTNGPAGGGGVETTAKESVGIVSALIDRDRVEPRVEMVA